MINCSVQRKTSMKDCTRWGRERTIARRPTHSSGKGLKPKMPSSVGRPMASANCVNKVVCQTTPLQPSNASN